MSNSDIHDLTGNDRDDRDGKLIISALNLHRLNYKPGSSGSDNRLRIPIPIKRRQLGQDDYPNFERQYIQNINIPTATKTENENEGAVQNQDDNYHFLMSLLPYLREVPKNRKMVIRHKLQKVFVEEQERRSVSRNTNANNPNFNSFMHNLQQIPRLPPPPYPAHKQNVGYKSYVPSATSVSSSASTSTSSGDLISQQQPILHQFPAAPPVGLSSGHQPLHLTYNTNNNNNNFSNYSATASVTNNANNNNFSNYSATASATNNAKNNNFSNYNSTVADNNTYTYQSAATGEPQTTTYLQ